MSRFSKVQYFKYVAFGIVGLFLSFIGIGSWCRMVFKADKSLLLEVTSSNWRTTTSLSSSMETESIWVRNKGSKSIDSPRLIVNGRKDWFDFNSILKEALGTAKTEREQATALWSFVVKNRYQGPPSHLGKGNYSPVLLFNAYGHALCDDAAVTLIMLAQAAGLEARGWTLTGHIISEIKIDDEWAMFDPAYGLISLTADGHRILGVEEIESNPDDFLRGANDKKMARNLIPLYVSTSDNAPSPPGRRPKPDRRTMRDVLRPGEDFVRSRKHWGKFIAFSDEEPAVHGNGSYEFSVDWHHGIRQLATDKSEGLMVSERNGRRVVELQQGVSEGYLQWVFESPYPYVDASFELDAMVTDPQASVEAYMSLDGVRWESLVRTAESGVHVVPFGHLLRSLREPPKHQFFLRVKLQGHSPGNVQLKHITLRREVQVAPAAFPDFRRGTNEILFRSARSGPVDVEVEFKLRSIPF